jgi:hypothetical protein
MSDTEDPAYTGWLSGVSLLIALLSYRLHRGRLKAASLPNIASIHHSVDGPYKPRGRVQFSEQ